MKSVSDIGEDALIRELTQHSSLQPNIIAGPGDDCAILQPIPAKYQLLKTDTIIENVHFLPDADPYWVGWKATARVVSDFAAMGGKPDSLVIALAIKADTKVDYLKQLYQGIHACAEKYQFSIVGGETSSHSSLVITVSGTGYCDSPVTRSSANVSDFLYVTGQLGNSITGKHLRFDPRIEEAQWIVNHLHPSSMMDLSDGMAKDLTRLADLSQVGFDLDLKKIPTADGADLKAALQDGEDYELLFTSPVTLTDELYSQWKLAFPQLELTVIGKITQSSRTPLTGGWEHFS